MLKTILLGLVVLTANVGIANAAIVPILEDAGILIGPGVDGNVHRFEVVSPGTYRATLTDFSFPESADSMAFMIATSSDFLGGALTPGSIVFNAAAGTHFMNVFGQPGSLTNVANYGVQIQATPLPTAAIMFAGSLVALVAVGRRLRGQA